MQACRILALCPSEAVRFDTSNVPHIECRVHLSFSPFPIPFIQYLITFPPHFPHPKLLPICVFTPPLRSLISPVGTTSIELRVTTHSPIFTPPLVYLHNSGSLAFVSCVSSVFPAGHGKGAEVGYWLVWGLAPGGKGGRWTGAVRLMYLMHHFRVLLRIPAHMELFRLKFASCCVANDPTQRSRLCFLLFVGCIW